MTLQSTFWIHFFLMQMYIANWSFSHISINLLVSDALTVADEVWIGTLRWLGNACFRVCSIHLFSAFYFLLLTAGWGGEAVGCISSFRSPNSTKLRRYAHVGNKKRVSLFMNGRINANCVQKKALDSKLGVIENLES